MIVSLLFIAFSLVLLYYGAEFLVKGSVSFALRLGVSVLIVGLTVVAFGTSTPELVVSLQAAVDGHGDISIGNVIGSNILNIACVLGLSAMIAPMKVHIGLIKVDAPILIGVTLLFFLFFLDNEISRIEGIVLFSGILLYVFYAIYRAKSEKQDEQIIAEEEGDDVEITKHWAIDFLLMIGGLFLMIVGSKLLVKHAVSIAESFGVSQAVIGLTIVAIGTSLPELATSLVAAIKKKNDIAIGNIIGSNLFNILAVLGSVAMIKPIYAPGFQMVDKIVFLLVALLLFPLMKKGLTITRLEGTFLFMIFLSYNVWLIWFS